MTTRNSLVIRIEGSAGDGILLMGDVVARIAARSGYHVCTLSSFSAEVRGGQSSYQLQIGCEELLSPGNAPDILVALNAQAVVNRGHQLTSQGLSIQPPDAAAPGGGGGSVVVDFEALAMQASGATRGKNLVAVGILVQLLGLDADVADRVVQNAFSGKRSSAIEPSLKSLRAGLEQELSSQPASSKASRLLPPRGGARALMSGNEALALGAIAGNVRFFAGYPITPASEVLEVLARHLPKVGGRSIQAEDEIASLGMCIGATFGGVRAATATSGPGLSLMVELLGLASMAELPLLIIDVQRAGPSTGMPTRDGQGDLNLAVYGAHGDAPRIVVAPQSVSDSFFDTVRAINLAHEFHVPALVLSSQALSHRMQTVDLPKAKDVDNYVEPLYEPTTDGSPYRRFGAAEPGMPGIRSIPGTPGAMHQVGGLEHDEFGQPNFEPEQRAAMVRRRAERMEAIARAVSERMGEDEMHLGRHPVGILSWAATAGVVREACQSLSQQGWDLGFLLPRVVWPLPAARVREFLASGIERLFVCEANGSGQMASLLRACFGEALRQHGIEVVSITKDDGEPFEAPEILEQLQKHLVDGHRVRKVI